MSTSNSLPPAPVPPWERPAQSPTTQTLTDAGDISLNCDVTYLDAGPTAENQPLTCALADGNYRRQMKRIYIRSARLYEGSAEWLVTGHFAGAGSLTFDAEGFNAALEWDGTGWHMMGGNAKVNV